MLVKRIWKSIKYRTDLKVCELKYIFGGVSNDKKNPYIMNSIETLTRIKEEKLSLCRYGDGEFYLMFGIDLPFQIHNEQIENDLKKVISNQNTSVLIGMPDTFQTVDLYETKSRAFWRSFHGKYHEQVLSVLPENYMKIKYANTNCTRFYSDLKDKKACIPIIKLFKEIWNERDIICIEGEKSRLGVGNDLFDNVKTFKRVLMPAKDAYEKMNDALTWISDNQNILSENTLFVLAIGPTATVMAYKLWERGYQALDLGHIDIQYEYYLRHADSKIAIPGKYTNENRDGRNPGDEILDDRYKNSIIHSCL